MKKYLLIVLLAAGFAHAQAETEQMTPEQMEQIMQSQMQMMVPMFGQMMQVMMNTQFDVLAQPETAQKLAAYTRNYYKALVAAGFTQEEALEIAMNVGIPSAPMMGK